MWAAGYKSGNTKSSILLLLLRPNSRLMPLTRHHRRPVAWQECLANYRAAMQAVYRARRIFYTNIWRQRPTLVTFPATFK
jgi:hypothetical protein